MTARGYPLPRTRFDDIAEKYEERLNAKQKRIEELEQALRFYANVDHYTYGVLSLSASEVQMDNGERARIALFESEVK